MHVDGVMGGITPHGLIHIAVYSERAALPQITVHNVSLDGKLSHPVSSEGKVGIVREIDADLMMNKLTAIEIRDWLSKRITELEQLEIGVTPSDGAMK
jgi:hypothetical protein